MEGCRQWSQGEKHIQEPKRVKALEIDKWGTLLSQCYYYINMSRCPLIQQYCQKQPIRLLSLPQEQHSLVQRLKIAQLHKHSLTTTSIPSSSNPPLSSVRFNPHDYRYAKQERVLLTLPRSLEFTTTIHSKTRKDMTHRTFSILEEGHTTKSRLTLLRQLMQKHYPPCLAKIPKKAVGEREQRNQKRQLGGGTIGRIFKRVIPRPGEKELRNMLIVSRVKNTADFSLKIRKANSSKSVPISS